MASVKEVLQYRGNNNYICCYCQDDENKNFVIFARTGGLYFNSEVENFELDGPTERIVPPLTKHNIDIPLSKNYYIMYVDDFKDYELINRILEVVWMEDNQ